MFDCSYAYASHLADLRGRSMLEVAIESKWPSELQGLIYDCTRQAT